MNRLVLIAVAGLVGGLFVPAPAGAQDTGKRGTIKYVQQLQTSTGGFLAMAPQPNIRLAPNLRATSAGVRALQYLGGDLPDKQACAKFVAGCYDAKSGGFANFPGGEPDVFTTAVGMMAVTGLDMSKDKYGPGVLRYLSENSKGFDDIRIAVAGLERLGEKSPKTEAWLAEVRKLQNDDGTFGKRLGQARDTGGAVVTLLRLGAKIDNRDLVVKVLQAGQRNSGGFGKHDSELSADLETSYRIMRCFMMLKARPADVEGMRSFVAKCRNADGGYGMSPGETSNVTPTYFASIILHWLDDKQ